MEDNGYVLLGWAEVGFVYVYANTPVRSTSDLKGVKLWMWEGDPIAEAIFTAFDVKPIPLSIIDVLTSLQTGLINGVYVAPYACVALQWHTRVKYMLNLPLADASGAVVITKAMYDRLPADLQEILIRNGRKYMRELTVRSRQENASAIATLKKSGIQILEIASPSLIHEYATLGKKARHALVGKLYDQALLDRAEKAVDEFRSNSSFRK
jgi:TRAP-type C4-dicarboxylate transport system substrate-binding protein